MQTRPTSFEPEFWVSGNKQVCQTQVSGFQPSNPGLKPGFPVLN